MRFIDWLYSFGLEQNICTPTHLISSHTLDLVIIRQDEIVADNFNVENPMLSNHYAERCNFLFYKPPIITKEIGVSKLRSMETELLITHYLLNSSLLIVPASDITGLVSQYHNTLSNIINAHIHL